MATRSSTLQWKDYMGRAGYNPRGHKEWDRASEPTGSHKSYNQSSSDQLTLKVFMFSPNSVWSQVLCRVTWNWLLACMIWFQNLCIIPLWLFYDRSSALMKKFFNKGSPPAFFLGASHLSSRHLLIFFFYSQYNVEKTSSLAGNWSEMGEGNIHSQTQWVSLYCWWLGLEQSVVCSQEARSVINTDLEGWETALSDNKMKVLLKFWLSLMIWKEFMELPWWCSD